MMISTKAKLAAMKILQSSMKNLKALYTNYFSHQKHFHCNTNMIHNKTISIHAIICVNIYHANLSTKIRIIPLWVLGWLKYFLSWHSDHVLHHKTSYLRQQNQLKYQLSVRQWLKAFRLKINSLFISKVIRLVIS